MLRCLLRFGSDGLRTLVFCCFVAAQEDGTDDESTITICTLGATLIALNSCSTMTDLVTSKLPESHSGRPTIIVSLRKQEAYIYRAGYITASSRISSGREGYRTPIGRFQVIRKDEDHRSSVYGDYVDNSGRIVKANVDSQA